MTNKYVEGDMPLYKGGTIISKAVRPTASLASLSTFGNSGSYVIVEEEGYQGALLRRFAEARNEETLVVKTELLLNANVIELGDVIQAYLADRNIASLSKSFVNGTVIIIAGNDALVFIHPSESSHHSNYPSVFKKGVRQYCVTLAGTRALLIAVNEFLDKTFTHQKHAAIKWWFRDAHQGLNSHTVYLTKTDTVLRPEFYPTVEKGPQNLIKEYLASSASVLLMEGVPGTGKTTLLRHLITENNLTANVVYDEILMQNDSLFQSFLFDDESDLLIIEDADVIITSREANKNHLMSRFLNVSDGLIKLPYKKLVFTTNISDFNRVDAALMRPGRCFGALHTRPLTFNEALVAAKAAGLPLPTINRPYTLAELFNPTQGAEMRRMGFVT